MNIKRQKKEKKKKETDKMVENAQKLIKLNIPEEKTEVCARKMIFIASAMRIYTPRYLLRNAYLRLDSYLRIIR